MCGTERRSGREINSGIGIPTQVRNVRDIRQIHLTGMILKVIRGAMIGVVCSPEAKDTYPRQHSGRAAEMSRRFSQLLGNDRIRTEQICLAASVHDIGKIGIPDSVLLCPGKLSDKQWSVMKSHPIIGADILTRTAAAMRDNMLNDGFFLPIPSEVAEQIEDIRGGILHHRERWDGKDYPDGLIGEDIPYISRLIALCDSTDAMMSRRVYRNALSDDICREKLRKNIGIMYAPAPGAAFVEHFDEITADIFPAAEQVTG